MRVLVTGANGLQGGAVVKQLRHTSYTTRVFLRSGEKAEQFQSDGVEVAIGNYADGDSIKEALHQVDYVFLTFPVQFDLETALSYCAVFIQAAKDSAVKRIVYNTSALYPDDTTGILLQEIRRQMEAAFKLSGLPFVILRPTLYLNNFLDRWSLPALVQQGILAYPVKPEQLLAWTTHELAATFAIHAFDQPGVVGKRFDLGNYLLTGIDIAASFSTALQRQVTYQFIDPLLFEQRLAQQAGREIAREVADSYRYIIQHPENYQKISIPSIPGIEFSSKPSVETWLQNQLLNIVL